MMVTINDERHVQTIAARAYGPRPLIFRNYRGDGEAYCSVHTDNRRGGELATQHLIEGGRRGLALVAGPKELQPVAERCRGFVDVLRHSSASTW